MSHRRAKKLRRYLRDNLKVDPNERKYKTIPTEKPVVTLDKDGVEQYSSRTCYTNVLDPECGRSVYQVAKQVFV